MIEVTDAMVEKALNAFNDTQDAPNGGWPMEEQRYMRAALEAALAVEREEAYISAQTALGRDE